MNRVRDESGFTMIELLISMALMVIVLGGIVNVLVSGTRAGANANARIDAQQNARLAVDRLEYEGRCSREADLINGGQGVAFTLLTTCTHATGIVSWCVEDGSLVRYQGDGCGTGTGQTFVDSVTSDAPFSIPDTPTGDLPVLNIDLTMDAQNDPATAASLTDTITLRNASRAS